MSDFPSIFIAITGRWLFASLAFLVFGVQVYAQDKTLSLRTEFLMELRADLASPQQEIGQTPLGSRTIVYVKGGSFSGPKLKGTLLPGGGDWILARRDGVSQLDVRITLRTEDGALIFVTYRGLTDIPGPVRQRLAKGEDVPPSEYYFRTAPIFESAVPKYAWLNRLIAVGVGRATATGVAYNIYAVK